MWGKSYDVDDFVRTATEQIEQYTAHRQRFDALARETIQRQEDLRTKQFESFFSLAATVIPDLTDTGAVSALTAKLSLPELNRLQTQFLEQLSRNRNRRAEIEGNDLFVNRDLHLLRLETKRDELEPLFQHTTLEWQKLQAQEKLPDLITRGFGTDQYAHRGWWRFLNPQFLDDWRCADAACEAFGVGDFIALRSAYQDRAEQMQVLGRDWEELRNERETIENLVAEREQLESNTTQLPRETYAKMGERIAAILENGKSVLVDTLPSSDALQSRLREIAGMEAQMQYLDGLRVQSERESGSIYERIEKLQDERDRYANNQYRFRNKRFSSEQWDKRFGAHRTARYEPLFNRYRRASDTVYVFHDYDRSNGLTDFLWWDVMTDGRLDGNFLPEVRSWRDDNPDYRYERYQESSARDSFDSSGWGNESFDTDPS